MITVIAQHPHNDGAAQRIFRIGDFKAVAAAKDAAPFAAAVQSNFKVRSANGARARRYPFFVFHYALSE
jgi:hypothetical protein